MRKIKFRVWDVFRKVFAKQITTFKFDRDGNINLIVYLDKVNKTREINELKKIYTNEFEVLYYTGLKDKNGKEIYEGDIVEYKTKFYDRLKEHKTIIKWEDDLEHNGFGEPFAMGYIFRGFDIEIIGNIYENPELIKRVEK